MIVNQKGSSRTKTYRKYVLRMGVNQKELSPMKVLRRGEKHKAFKKVLTQTKKNMHMMKQKMKNLWLQVIQSSMSQVILNYSSVVKLLEQYLCHV